MKILVTGSSRGIGKEIRDHFLKLGHQVLGISRNQIDFEHENYIHYPLDLSDLDAVELFCTKVKGVDVLINSAAFVRANLFNLVTKDELVKTMNVNVISPFMLTQHLSKGMIKNQFGRIINISSIVTELDFKGEASYTISKAALEKMTEVAALELAPFNITINTLSISIFESDLVKNLSLNQICDIKEKLVLKTPLNISDILNAIDFYTDKRSAQITRQNLKFGGVI